MGHSVDILFIKAILEFELNTMVLTVEFRKIEIIIFLVGICLFIFFGGFAVYLYIQFNTTNMEKSIM